MFITEIEIELFIHSKTNNTTSKINIKICGEENTDMLFKKKNLFFFP